MLNDPIPKLRRENGVVVHLEVFMLRCSIGLWMGSETQQRLWCISHWQRDGTGGREKPLLER